MQIKKLMQIKTLMQIKKLMQIKSMRSTGFKLSLSKLTAGFRLLSMWLSNGGQRG